VSTRAESLTLAPVPGDILKLYLAAVLLPGAWRLVERIKRLK
jgi:hypothetical protein